MGGFVKRLIGSALTAVVLVSLCGCQQSPEKQSVVSKNDGSFDKSVIVPATEVPDVADANSMRTVSYTDEFNSTDNSVVFTFNIHEELDAPKNSVVEVAPHFLTGEDARRVADILLPDAEWYEGVKGGVYTKEQIQEKVNRWTKYASSDALAELYGNSDAPEELADRLDTVQSAIQRYTERYESAPSGSPEACGWTFQKDCLYYSIPESELTEQDFAQANDQIRAIAKVGEREYTFSVSTRNKSDFKLNSIYLYMEEGTSPKGIDGRIYSALLCRTKAPTEDDVAAVAAKAQKMLDDMDLGQWQIDTSFVQTTYYGDAPEYTINLTAVPVFNGVAAIPVPQITNLKSQQSYASNYYMSEVTFQFSGNGDLMGFHMQSPTDPVEVLSENASVKDMDELMELAKDHLTLSDYNEYGYHPDLIKSAEEEEGGKLVCNVDISQMEYGMLRVKVPNTDESYYYVPGMILYGSVDYVGSKTGKIYYSSGASYGSSRISPLVAINAVDGSNIELYVS